MKTSILISSFAALCLLITFAEAPRRYAEDKMNLASTDNVSIVTMKKATMLPGVVIVPGRNMEASITVAAIPAEEFNYLKFDVNEYMGTDAFTPDEAGILPETSEADLSYLKFDVSNYYTGSALTDDKLLADELEYLRFDANDYTKNSIKEVSEIEELPLNEAETTNELSYLRFEVTEYYNTDNFGFGEQFELPEE